MKHSVESRVPEPAEDLSWRVSELLGTLGLGGTKATRVQIFSSLSPSFAYKQAELFSRTWTNKVAAVEIQGTVSVRC